MLEKIKKLRNETGISLMECKKACEETGGDIDQAREILRKRGQAMASKRLDRETGEGLIDSYIHDNNKVGVLLDIRCESDFVARSDDFRKLSREVALQIAAMNPLYLREEEIPIEVIEKEKEIAKEQIEGKKSEEIIEKIISGKIEGYKKENCLLSQEWIKDKDKTIEDLVKEAIAKTGENITVSRFTRYELR